MFSNWAIVVREIQYRKLNFAFGVAGASIAIGLLVGVLSSFELYDLRSEEIASRQATQANAMMASLRSDVRNAMHHLGFNAIVLPADQPLGDWYADDYASRTMPQSWAMRLDGTHELVDRYQPRLRQKLTWPEHQLTILVVGCGVERILDTSVGTKSRLSTEIPPGSCVLGYELHNALELRRGEEIAISGRPFRILRCDRELGTKDDITVWMDLGDAQQLLDEPQRINEIMLVEHLSVWGNLAALRRNIANALPDCKVVEIASETRSRTQARVKTADEARAAVEHEREKQARLRAQRNRTLLVLLPLGSIACVCWVGFLAYQNVQDRATELAALMAIGFRARDVRKLVLSKAAVVGLGGACGGCLLGLGTTSLLSISEVDGVWIGLPVAILYFALALTVGVATSVLGSWLPAQWAAGSDPAEILREE